MKSRSINIVVIMFFLAVVLFNSSIVNADIHVYDKNNQYLGILLDLSTEDLHVFIPSLGADWGVSYDEVDACPGSAYFESSNCTGTPYEKDPLPSIQDLSASTLGGFYLPDYDQKKTFSHGSYIDWNCDCQVVSGLPSEEYYQLIEVQIPFTIPIALPLRFEVRNRAVVIPMN